MHATSFLVLRLSDVTNRPFPSYFFFLASLLYLRKYKLQVCSMKRKGNKKPQKQQNQGPTPHLVEKNKNRGRLLFRRRGCSRLQTHGSRPDITPLSPGALADPPETDSGGGTPLIPSRPPGSPFPAPGPSGPAPTASPSPGPADTRATQGPRLLSPTLP